MDHIILTTAQVAAAKAKLEANILKANAEFIAGNDYVAPDMDTDVIALMKALVCGKPVDSLDCDKELAQLRYKFVEEGNGRAIMTMDLLIIKTDAGVADQDKFQLTPYLGLKRYKIDGSVWKQGYQSPADGEPLNKLIQVDGSSFQVLRQKKMVTLMTAAEVKAFVKDVNVDFDLYFQLFL